MSNEETISIAELADVNPKVDLRGLRDDAPVSFIPMSDVTEGGQWLNHQERRLDEARFGYTPFAENDVLFAKITPCMENGKGAHVTGLKHGVGFGSTEFHVLRSRGDTSARYLYHWLQDRRTRTRAIAYMGGSAGQQRVQSDFFRNFRVRKLSPDEQSRVATILDTVDEAIAKTEAVIAKLRQVRAGLLHDLLTRGLDENGQLRDPVGHPEMFQITPLGLIPKAWSIRRLEELSDVDRGKFAHRPRNEPRFYGGKYPFIQTGDIANAAGEIIDSFTQTLNDEGAAISRQFPENTVAITIAANIADTAILGRPMFLTDSVVGAIVKPPNNVRFVELSLRRAKPRLEARAPQTAQRNINLQDLRPLEIPTPSDIDEQNGISAQYEAHMALVRVECTNLSKLQQVKAGLMSDLLAGRVRVHTELQPAETKK